jgi:hypothetical protein
MPDTDGESPSKSPGSPVDGTIGTTCTVGGTIDTGYAFWMYDARSSVLLMT